MNPKRFVNVGFVNVGIVNVGFVNVGFVSVGFCCGLRAYDLQTILPIFDSQILRRAPPALYFPSLPPLRWRPHVDTFFTRIIAPY